VARGGGGTRGGGGGVHTAVEGGETRGVDGGRTRGEEGGGGSRRRRIQRLAVRSGAGRSDLAQSAAEQT
jgi:hypothetical protein